MGAKAVIRDAGRALDMPFSDVDRIAKLVPNVLNITLKDALAQSPEMRQLKEREARVAELIEVAGRLEGLARHASTHAAGVVISPQPLQEIVPLYKSSKDEITTQYAMDDLETIGLLKMDFLGLTTLTVIDDCLKLIEATRGERLDFASVPLDDSETYELLGKGLTAGIFQFESRGMTDILRRAKPNRLADLIALNGLYRPGPMGMIDDFVARKLGRKRVTYDLPQLKDILEETYGVIVYQEQVIQIAASVAGFSLGEADILRRAMGKKKPEDMAAMREKFLAGARRNGVAAAKAEKLFELVKEFAGYGFNKSHSAAYAFIAYQTAYLKAHYPVEFMSALLSSEMGNQDKLIFYLNECRDMGINILPPDVNSSQHAFTPDGKSIRFGLTAIKNVGETAMQSVLAARQQLGRFDHLFQFCETVDLRLLHKHVTESLINAGPLDSPGARRRQLMALLLTSLRVRPRKKGDLWASGVLEDLRGTAELLVFPQALQQLQGVLKPETALVIKGRVRHEENAPPRVVVSEARPLDAAVNGGQARAADRRPELRIRLNLEDASRAQNLADQLEALLSAYPGSNPVVFELTR